MLCNKHYVLYIFILVSMKKYATLIEAMFFLGYLFFIILLFALTNKQLNKISNTTMFNNTDKSHLLDENNTRSRLFNVSNIIRKDVKKIPLMTTENSIVSFLYM